MSTVRRLLLHPYRPHQSLMTGHQTLLLRLCAIKILEDLALQYPNLEIVSEPSANCLEIPAVSPLIVVSSFLKQTDL